MDELTGFESPSSISEPGNRLGSWKEVANYLNVSVRTVQRWEKSEGLPIHRHQHGVAATVCAFKSEVDAWWRIRRSPLDQAGEIPQVREAHSVKGKGLPSAAGALASPSIAVLPFANFSDDRQDVYFSDGLAEEIINALSKMADLHVTARTSSFAFRGKEQDIREIGARLNVATILEGSFAKVGSRIRVTVQLIKVSDGFHLWSERYDRELTDVFTIQDEICHAIVEKLRVQLRGSRPQLRRHSENLEAYTLFLQGHYHQYRFTPEGVEKSRECFERAIAVDPQYALAHFGIAMYHWFRGFLCLVVPREAFSQCESAVQRALEVDDSVSEAHALQGCILVLRDFNWKGAQQAFQRALELDPTSLDSRDLYSFYFLLPRGRLGEAIAEAELELPRDPLSAWHQFRLGYRFLLNREFDRATAQLKKSLELDPDYCASYWVLASAYFHERMLYEAVLACEKHTALSERSPWGLGTLAYAYGRAGRVQEARALLEELRGLSRIRYVAPSSFAHAYFGLGEHDRGFECLEQAIEDRDGTIIHIAVDPFYDFIRPDPRYRSLLRKMNLGLGVGCP